jgi:hypothetical protein
MRRSSATIVAGISLVTLGGAWYLGQPPVITTHSAVPGTGSAPTTTPGESSVTSSATSSAIPAPTVPPTVSVDGSVVTTKYGTVQVRAVFVGPQLVDVIALKLTDSGTKSVELSAAAAPILREAVLAAQSTAVDTVSGATYTSDAYLTSLQAAIDSAGR